MNQGTSTAPMPGVRQGRPAFLTQEMFDNFMEYAYRDPLPFPPEYAFMFGKYKHNCEGRKAFGVAKLDGLSSMAVKECYASHDGAEVQDGNFGRVSPVHMVPVSYLVSKNSS